MMELEEFNINRQTKRGPKNGVLKISVTIQHCSSLDLEELPIFIQKDLTDLIKNRTEAAAKKPKGDIHPISSRAQIKKPIGSGLPRMSKGQVGFLKTLQDRPESEIFSEFKKLFPMSSQKPENVVEMWRRVQGVVPPPPALTVTKGALVRFKENLHNPKNSLNEVGKVINVEVSEGKALVKFKRASQSVPISDLEVVDPGVSEITVKKK